MTCIERDHSGLPVRLWLTPAAPRALCVVCGTRPCRLSGRTTTCRLCDGGHERNAARRPVEKSQGYLRGLRWTQQRRVKP